MLQNTAKQVLGNVAQCKQLSYDKKKTEKYNPNKPPWMNKAAEHRL
jgi:hypothetical protein